MTTTYLLAGQTSELERLTAQSRAWEPAGRAVLDELPDGDGTVVGLDIDPAMLDAARALVDGAGLRTVQLVRDDIFASDLEPRSFDLVHARFQLAPLGRVEEQLAVYRRWLKPGGWLVLEDPDPSTWRFEPEAPAAERLIAAILAAFRSSGGAFDAGLRLPGYLATMGTDPRVRRTVLELGPEDGYIRLPLQFARALEGRIAAAVGAAALEELRAAAAVALDDPSRCGTSFTLVSAWGRLPG